MAKSQSIIRKCGVVNFNTQEIQETQKAQIKKLQREISEMQTLMFESMWRREIDLAESLEQGILSRRARLADLEACN